MHRYKLYGRSLASELEFPQLEPQHDSVADDWILRVRSEPAHLDGAVQIGEEWVQRIRSRLWRHASGYRVDYDDTGVFDISLDGREIFWSGPEDDHVDLRFVDFTGRVVAVALHARGLLTLHGSSAVIGSEGVAFLAPKGSGKSTLAMSLALAGARLASDDMVVVEPTESLRTWPGPASLRLWNRTIKALGLDYLSRTLGAGSKYTLSKFPPEMVATEPFSLSTIYVLTPAASDALAGAAVERQLLDRMPATLQIVSNSKAGSLFNGPDSGLLLKQISVLTNTIPVYHLRVARDYALLPEVVEQIFAWHGAIPSNRPVLEPL